jgi:hypothetical protein
LVLVASSFTAIAQNHGPNGIDYDKFGISEKLAARGQCVARNLSPQQSDLVARTYWFYPVPDRHGNCAMPNMLMSKEDQTRGRGVFLIALSNCLGYRVKTDEDIFVQQVGFATSVTVANGTFSFERNETLLDTLDKGSVQCHQRLTNTAKSDKFTTRRWMLSKDRLAALEKEEAAEKAAKEQAEAEASQ